MDRTLILVKPDATQRNLGGAISGPFRGRRTENGSLEDAAGRRIPSS